MIDVNRYPDVDVYQQQIAEGAARLTILRGGWTKDYPQQYMDEVVSEFMEGKLHNQFVEIHLDIPQVRVIIEGINDIHYDDLKAFFENLK
jgi:hypothetical protein